jgi:hypothetical protein
MSDSKKEFLSHCAPSRTRTGDLMIKSHMLYQLSYGCGAKLRKFKHIRKAHKQGISDNIGYFSLHQSQFILRFCYSVCHRGMLPIFCTILLNHRNLKIIQSLFHNITTYAVVINPQPRTNGFNAYPESCCKIKIHHFYLTT